MKGNNFVALRADIDEESKELSRLMNELSAELKGLGSPPGSLEIRGISSIIHDFYTGLEKIFVRIARRIDGGLPQEADWHIQLLKRMSAEIPGVRPPLFDDAQRKELLEYLRFRHLFRNSYGFTLEWERCEAIARKAPEVFARFQTALHRFHAFLDSLTDI